MAASHLAAKTSIAKEEPRFLPYGLKLILGKAENMTDREHKTKQQLKEYTRFTPQTRTPGGAGAAG